MKISNELGLEAEAPVLGYGVFRHILSDSDLILFSVPGHGWNELEQSKEWKDFQILLEKFQEGYFQRQPQAGRCQREAPDYTETCGRQLPSHAGGCIRSRIWDMFQSVIHYPKRKL